MVSFVDALGDGEDESEEEGGVRMEAVPEVRGNVSSRVGMKAGTKRIPLLLAGYSYGSLITTHLPPVDEVVKVINSAIETSPEYMTCLAALRGCAQEWSMRTRGIPAAVPKTAIAVPISGAKIQPSYLLISPLLPPLSSFLTLSIFSPTASSNLMSERLEAHKRGKILVVHGDMDIFTSVDRYKKWEERWTVGERGAVIQTRKVVRVSGAGHLWLEKGVIGKLIKAVEEWLMS